VPWVTAGLGASWNDVNDSTSESTRFATDELTIAGSLAAGFDYFLAEDVAVGLGLHSFLYPQQHTDYLVVDSSGRHQRSGSLNYNSFAVAGHLRFFLGEAAAAGEARPRHLFLAEHGPFDTDEMRGYAVGLFGYTPMLDDDFGDDVRHASGDINITTGGALGMNFDRHWGAEVQMLVVDRDLVQGASARSERSACSASFRRCASATRSSRVASSRSPRPASASGSSRRTTISPISRTSTGSRD
jgi:hypothetical protein